MIANIENIARSLLRFSSIFTPASRDNARVATRTYAIKIIRGRARAANDLSPARFDTSHLLPIRPTDRTVGWLARWPM